ncbi:hypothetical protein [Rhodoblastus sp.]
MSRQTIDRDAKDEQQNAGKANENNSGAEHNVQLPKPAAEREEGAS